MFSYCESHQPELFDKRYCYNRNFIQRNNTPFILEKLANNLFCILYDNLPPTYDINYEVVRLKCIMNVKLNFIVKLFILFNFIQDIKTAEDLREVINSNRPTWKWTDQIYIPEYNTSTPYQDGDVMWIIYNNYIQPFGIYNYIQYYLY